MKILPINKTAFYGRTVSYRSSAGSDGIKMLQGFYPDSTIEKTLGVSHKVPRNSVYFADPMEFVSNDMKYNVDYVVYDNEPAYPAIEDIGKNYLDKNRTNYREKFERVRDYFYRREMGGHANSNEAKYQQWQAAECIRLYDKAGDLRYKKETAEDELKDIQKEKLSICAGIANTRRELDAQMQLKCSVELHLKNLEKIREQGIFDDLFKLRAMTNEKVLYSVADARVKDALHKKQMREALENTAYYNEGIEAYPYDKIKWGKYTDTVRVYASIKEQMEKAYCIGPQIGNNCRHKTCINETIKAFEGILADNATLIDEMTSYIDELSGKINSFDEKVIQKESFIESCKEKLAPLFEELKAYYLKQGIKAVKK
jgi:hypothetical protein